MSISGNTETLQRILDAANALPEQVAVVGPPGYTPQKGIDYFTEDDKAEIVNDVLAALPSWTGGSY